MNYIQHLLINADLVERSGGFANEKGVFPRIIGKDFAGVIKEVGKDVTNFNVGAVAGIR